MSDLIDFGEIRRRYKGITQSFLDRQGAHCSYPLCFKYPDVAVRVYDKGSQDEGL